MAETVIGYVFDNKGYHPGGQYFEGDDGEHRLFHYDQPTT